MYFLVAIGKGRAGIDIVVVMTLDVFAINNRTVFHCQFCGRTLVIGNRVPIVLNDREAVCDCCGGYTVAAHGPAADNTGNPVIFTIISAVIIAFSGLGRHIGGKVAAPVNIDGNIRDGFKLGIPIVAVTFFYAADIRIVHAIPRAQVSKNADSHRSGLNAYSAAVDTVIQIDCHNVGGVLHLHFAKDAADVVCAAPAINRRLHRAMVLTGQDVDRRVGDRRIIVSHNTAHCTAVTAAVVEVRLQVAEVVAVLKRAAVVRPKRNDAARIAGTTVIDRAEVNTVCQRPPVTTAVVLVADDAANLHIEAVCGIIVINIIAVIGIALGNITPLGRVIARFPERPAAESTHGSAVYHSIQRTCAGHIGFVLSYDAANGGIIAGCVIRIDEPLTAGRAADAAVQAVESGNSAQVTAGKVVHILIAAAQADKQIVSGQTRVAVNVRVALIRHSVNALEIHKVGHIANCSARPIYRVAAQRSDNCIGVSVSDPLFQLGHQIGLHSFAAAALDSAVVGARNAAHKAVTRRDDAARAVAALGGDIAVGDFDIVAARNAAHMAGTGELFVCGLGRGDVADTADLQFDVFDLTAGDCAIVQTGNAAHRAAGAARTDGDKAVRVRVAAHRAGIGTLIQGTVVLACDAAQICIFIKILCKVQQNFGAADRAVLRGAAHRAAQRDGVGARAQAVVQRQRAVFDLTAGDGALVHARKAADGDRRGAEPHVGVCRQLHVADGRARAVVRCNSADALRRAGDRAAAYAAVVFQPAVLADGAEVRGRDAARRAVGRGDVGLDLHILNQRVFIIIARDAARLAVGGVDRSGIAGRMAAIADFAALVVHARNTARILCAGAHRGVVIHTGDFGTVRTGHAACVVGGSDAAPDRAGGVFSAVNTALIRIDTGHTARIAGSGDTALQLAGQRDIADVGTGHAARILVGLHRVSAVVLCADDEALACRSVTAQVDARNAADIAVTAHGTALRRVGRLNKTAVDARNAAQIGIPGFTVAEGRRHPAAGDRALVPARKAARGALVSHCAVVFAAFQRCVGCGIADDTARQCAARGAKIIAATGQRVQRYAAFKRAVGRVQAADGQGVLHCAVGCLLNRQLRFSVVCTDDAADVDVGLQVEHVLEVGKDDLVVRRFHVGAVGQHAGALVNLRQQRLQRDLCGLVLQQTVVADDAARDGVGLDAARGHICFKRAARHGEAAHRQVGADDAADKLLTRHAADLHSGGGQRGGAVQADHAADSLARRHDLAVDGQLLAGGVGDRRLFIVITGHAAHVVVAVQDGTQRRGAALIPRHNAFFSIAARDAADVVGVVGVVARGAAQLL